MGALNCKLVSTAYSLLNADVVKPVFNVGKAISSPLFRSIVKDANEQIEDDQTFPIELVMECMEFVGFIMHSTMLNDEESSSFYKLLIDHHRQNQIISPLVDAKSITYFDLLYRESEHGKHCNQDMIKTCRNKSNIIMIFHTNYDHIFSVYFRNTLKWNVDSDITRSTPYDDNSALFVLRTRYKYGDMIHPRKITINPETITTSDGIRFQSFSGRVTMNFMGIKIRNKTSKDPHYIKVNYRLNTIGNEICGGESYDDTVRGHRSVPKCYDFGLKDLEVYQIV